MTALRGNGVASGSTKAERNAEICAKLRAGGATITDLAQEHGITRERVRQIALRDGITARTYLDLRPPSKTVMKAREVVARAEARKAAKAALIARIVELRAQGMTQAEITKIVGRSQRFVSSELIEAGHRSRHLPIRVFPSRKRKKQKKRPIRAPLIVGLPKGEHPREVVAQALTLWMDGLSAQQIAIRLNSPDRTISKNVIIGIAHRNNFPPRPSPLRG